MKKIIILAILFFISSSSLCAENITTEDFIKRKEKCKTQSYLGLEKRKTIGYGFVGLKQNKMSCSDAEKLLREKINEISLFLKNENLINLSKNQSSSLISLIYNIGIPSFKNSKMLIHLKRGNYEKASEEFSAWVFVKGRVIKGLQERRKEEKLLFLQR